MPAAFNMMKSLKVILIMLLVATVICCWQSMRLAHIRMAVVDAPVVFNEEPARVLQRTYFTETGIVSDPIFRVALRALERQGGAGKLAEPDVVTTRGRQSFNHRVNIYEGPITFYTTNR
jgi:hypothetical protein